MKPRKPIRKVSLKRARQMRIYSAKRRAFLSVTPLCQRCEDARATDIHHSNGRTGERLNDSSRFFALCRSCHSFIHSHPKEARAQGFLV